MSRPLTRRQIFMRFESTVEIKASPKSVWTAVHDPAEWPAWIPSVRKIEQLTVGPLGVGTRLRIKVRSGFYVTLHMTITEFLPGERVVMEGRVLGTRLTRWYRLEGAEGCTRAIAGGDVSGLLSCFVCRRGQKLSDEITRSFKKRVEG